MITFPENLISENLIDNLFVLRGGNNTGMLVSGNRAVLFNCCDSVTPDKLEASGIKKVDKIFCTQYRRTTAAGIYGFAENGAEIIVPEKEKYLFTGTDSFWSDPKNRWHIYNFMPDTDVLPRPVPSAIGVAGICAIDWEGYAISVIDTPGATLGGVSYVVEVCGRRFCFCGDLIYEDGKILDLYSLARAKDGLSGYHGFMASYRELISSLRNICGRCDFLIPAHGGVISEPELAVSMLEKRLDSIYENYSAVSGLNYYFPGMLSGGGGLKEVMKPVDAFPFPEFVKHVAYTSNALISDDKAVFLIDCGDDSVVETLEKWKADGDIAEVECCWVTHYHDDHVNSLATAVERFGCKVYASDFVSDIIEHPENYILPCISPVSTCVEAVREGFSWKWHEFLLTAFHFPGQSLYHGGLLAEGHGVKVFFAGDSGSPAGIDDYCLQNRNFLGRGRGSLKTMEILKRIDPDFIVNQHQLAAYRFTDKEYDFIECKLSERENIYRELFPWPAPDFGLDGQWARSCPYEQKARPEGVIEMEMHFTNHSETEMKVHISPVLPCGWTRIDKNDGYVRVPARTCGVTGDGCENPDGKICVRIRVPAQAQHGRHIIPFKIYMDDRYLGWLKHAIVDVGENVTER